MQEVYFLKLAFEDIAKRRVQADDRAASLARCRTFPNSTEVFV